MLHGMSARSYCARTGRKVLSCWGGKVPGSTFSLLLQLRGVKEQ